MNWGIFHIAVGLILGINALVLIAFGISELNK